MQTMKQLYAAAPVALALALTAPAGVLADSDRANLKGGAENPPVVTFGEGAYRSKSKSDRIEFHLTYEGLAIPGSDVLQAHLHVANPGQNGTITVFLCTNLGNTPAGATARSCPPSPGKVEGDIVAADVQAAGANLSAGDLEGLKKLIKDGAVYANVHTNEVTSGEIRGQINAQRR